MSTLKDLLVKLIGKVNTTQQQLSRLSLEKVDESCVNALIDEKLGVIENGAY